MSRFEQRIESSRSERGRKTRSPSERGAPALLADREGHTELGVTVAQAAGLSPAVVVCEMLDDETGRALSPVAAEAYADRNDVHYVEGECILERFERGDDP